MESKVLLSTAYLAPIQYYSKILHYNETFISSSEKYEKQSYRTRCNIAAANGILSLSIPVEKIKTSIADTRIAYDEDWQRLHWKSIESAYQNSPFYDYYADDFRAFFTKKWNFLLDFNTEIQQLILSLLNINSNISLCEPQKDYVDFRNEIHPKKDLSDSHFEIVPYYQVFEEKHGFLPNLSIIDLLFNMGNEARIILKKSWKE